ncbi:hypothetical protein FC764_13990 [Clostridium botulinum]|nr:hypothetical protein [Clostridium botulinum]
MARSYYVGEVREEEVNGHKLRIEDGSISIDGDKITIDNYDIYDFIGSGANGIVLKAKEKISDMDRAIKIWIPNYLKGKSNITRGREEIRKISQLEHKNIVRYYSTGESGGLQYCVLEEIDGVSIRKYIEEYDPPLAIRYDIISKILDALRYTHEKDIYHGDLHEDNILIEKDGTIKLLDFGTSVFGKGISLARDSRLLYSTSMFILGKYIDSRILNINMEEIKKLSPKVVRLIVKAASKITVLLELAKYGIVDTVIEDISLFSMIVPFFNLKYIAILIGNSPSGEKLQSDNVVYYMNRLIYDGGNNILKYNLYDKLREMNEKNIYEFYKIIQSRFIDLVNNNNKEEFIYKNLNEAQIFNGPLYANITEVYNERRALGENQIELKEITKVLESSNM